MLKYDVGFIDVVAGICTRRKKRVLRSAISISSDHWLVDRITWCMVCQSCSEGFYAEPQWCTLAGHDVGT